MPGKKKNKEIIERRIHEDCSFRAIRDDDGKITELEGYAIVYNEYSDDLGGFVEKIAPGAAGKSIRKRKSDVRALHNHDSNFVWGRQKAKTLKMKEDEHGLRVNIFPDEDISWQADIIKSIERGDINQMSFGFWTVSDSWEKEDKTNVRTLNEVELFDVSTVTFPAYPQTTIGVRSAMERVGLNYNGIERALVRMEHSLDLEDEDRAVIGQTVDAFNKLIPPDGDPKGDEDNAPAQTPEGNILQKDRKRKLRNRNLQED